MSCAVYIPGEGYSFDVDRLVMAADDHHADNMAFIGHLQKFLVDGVDVIDLLRRHVTSDDYTSPGDHSVLSHSGTLTSQQLPIPVHPVTLRTSQTSMTFLRLPMIDMSHGNASLKLMFMTQVMQCCRPPSSP